MFSPTEVRNRKLATKVKNQCCWKSSETQTKSKVKKTACERKEMKSDKIAFYSFSLNIFKNYTHCFMGDNFIYFLNISCKNKLIFGITLSDGLHKRFSQLRKIFFCFKFSNYMTLANLSKNLKLCFLAIIVIHQFLKI